jgi:O-antigen/teichoic acid export membrane protein
MRSRLFSRRAATAVGMYSATALGVLGTIVAARRLGPTEYGVLAIVLAAAGFLQSLLDLTVEEAAVKYGFRYSTIENWGRFRRFLGLALMVKVVGGLLAGLALVVLAPFASGIWSSSGLLTPILIVALLPLVQAPEGLAGVALLLRGRYDLRAGFLALSSALRLTAFIVGSRYGVTQTVLAVVAAQVLATAAIAVAGIAAIRRFPRTEPVPLAEDRKEIGRFVLQSSLATTVLSMRGMLGPLALGTVASAAEVGYFRTSQAPQSAMASISAPVRMVLLTEQTRDWERGRKKEVFAGLRRYTIGAALLGIVLLPPLIYFMPDLVRIVYGAKFLPAVDAARLIALAAVIQFLVGWSKSFPVSIGRPGLRVLTHGIEVAVFVPLVFVLGLRWGATGAAAAVLVSSIAFTIVWAFLIVSIHHRTLAEEPPEKLAAAGVPVP